MTFDIFETPPIFVNEIGVKFWIDKGLTSYLNRADHNGIAVEGQVFAVEEKDGNRTRLVVIDNQPVYENPKLEDTAVWIDAYKADLHFSKKS